MHAYVAWADVDVARLPLLHDHHIGLTSQLVEQLLTKSECWERGIVAQHLLACLDVEVCPRVGAADIHDLQLSGTVPEVYRDRFHEITLC